MPGPTVAAFASTAATVSARIPAASPRQPQWAMATPCRPRSGSKTPRWRRADRPPASAHRLARAIPSWRRLDQQLLGLVLWDLATGGGQGDPKLLIPARQLSVELAGERRLQAAADCGPLRDPRLEQVVAGDLEADVSPLRRVAIEPLCAESPSDEQLRRVPGLRQPDGLGGALRCRRRQLANLRQRPDDRQRYRQLWIDPPDPGLARGEARDFGHTPGGLGIEARHDPPVEDQLHDGGGIGFGG